MFLWAGNDVEKQQKIEIEVGEMVGRVCGIKRLCCVWFIVGIIFMGVSAVVCCDDLQAESWIKTYDTPKKLTKQLTIDEYRSIVPYADGGYLALAKLDGFGSDLSYDEDFIGILKLDKSGDIVAQKYYVTDESIAYHLDQLYPLEDGGFLLYSSNREDLIVRFDVNGDILWKRGYHEDGVSSWYAIEEITVMDDGGFLVSAMKSRFESSGDEERTTSVWLMRLDDYGNILWNKYFTEDKGKLLSVVLLQENNNGIILGCSGSEDNEGVAKFTILQMDHDGNIIGQKSFHTKTNGIILNVEQTKAGDFIVGIYSPWSDSSIVVLKLDSAGNVDWQKRCLLPKECYYNDMQVMVTGDQGVHLSFDLYGKCSSLQMIKFDIDGNLKWKKNFGSPMLFESSTCRSRQTDDGGFIWAGVSHSPLEGLTGLVIPYGGGLIPMPGRSTWVMKTDATGSIPRCSLVRPSSISIEPADLEIESVEVDFRESVGWVDISELPEVVETAGVTVKEKAETVCTSGF